jgi:hypothetical protein
MRQYLRLLKQLAPYRLLLAGALFATLMFAALDTFSFVMVFPFLDALFLGNAVDLYGAGETIGRLLENTIGRLLVPGADPMQAITALCIAIAVVFML